MKGRIALVQPYVDPGRSLGIRKAPTGIQYIAAQLESYDVMIFHDYADRINAALKTFQPEHVGVSSMSNNFPEARAVAEFVKANFEPNVSVTLGGWHSSGCIVEYQKWQNTNGIHGERETLEEILHHGSPFDFVMNGEGEFSYRKFLGMLQEGATKDSLAVVSGIGFLDDNGNIALTAPQSIADLNKLNHPSWKGLNFNEYRDLRTGDLDISVHFNRGCRFACDFCATPGIYGRGVRTTGATRAVDYIESLLRNFRPNVITFTDEDFFVNLKWVEEVTSEIARRNLNVGYNVRFDTFATVMDIHRFQKNGKGNLLDRMMEAGFSSFTIGVETLNGATIELYNKADKMVAPMMTEGEKTAYRSNLFPDRKRKLLEEVYFREVQRAINFAHEHGILIIGDYIIGHPTESEADVRMGFERFSNLQNLFFAYVPIYTPFPGVGLWGQDYRSGKIIRTAKEGIDWSRFDASAGAMRLDYDGQQLRDGLEQRFYTSERYQRDMAEELQRNPARLNMFRNRFAYLNNMYPANTKISRILGDLRKTR